MIEIGEARQLILFKLFTITLSCGVLYLIRAHARATVGAWLCTLILAVLTMHWLDYNERVSAFTNEFTAAAYLDTSGQFIRRIYQTYRS